MRCARLLPILAILGLALPGDALGQAGISLIGLGRVEDPTDVRIRALGGAGVVTHGRNLSLLNPAMIARLPSAGLHLGSATESRDLEGDMLSGSVRGTRFPVIHLVAPVGESFSVGVGFSGFLDQDWLVSFRDTLFLAEDTVPFTENRESDGGVSRIRGTVAWIPGAKVQLGVGLDLYSGDVSREARRRFDDPSAGFEDYRDPARFEYRAWGFAVGVLFAPNPDLYFGADLAWMNDLTAERDTFPDRSSFPMPLRLDVGGSWRIAPDAMWAWRVGFANWSRTANALPDGAEDTWSVGTGLELQFARGESSALLGRAGYRRGTLPFTAGGDQASEHAWTVGLGGTFAGGLVGVDLAFELGSRGDVGSLGIRESFRRFSFGLSVYQRTRS